MQNSGAEELVERALRTETIYGWRALQVAMLRMQLDMRDEFSVGLFDEMACEWLAVRGILPESLLGAMRALEQGRQTYHYIRAIPE